MPVLINSYLFLGFSQITPAMSLKVQHNCQPEHKVRQEEIGHLIHDAMLKAENLNDPSHNSNLEIRPESFKLQAHARSSNFYKAYPCTLIYSVL